MAGRHTLKVRHLSPRFIRPAVARHSISSSSQSYPKRPALSLGGVTLKHFEDLLRNNNFNRLTPQQYYGRAEKFVKFLQPGKFPDTISDESLPPEVLHELGCILCLLSELTKLSVPLWVCASNMGFAPSTISMVMELVRRKSYGRYKVFRKVEARFQQLVLGDVNPDAMTVNGQLLFVQDQFHKSVVALKRALRVGSPDFELRPTCLLFLAKSLSQLGRETEAMTLIDELAKDGLTGVHVGLASIYKVTDPVRSRQHLYEAALGRPELYRDLSELTLEDAAKSSSGREQLERLAYEWSRLADPSFHH